MALLVLISTMSVTVEKHFCGNALVDVAVFTEVNKCKMEVFEKEISAVTKKSCCKDTVDLYEGQDELQSQSIDDLSFDQEVLVTSFFNSYLSLFEDTTNEVVPHKDYRPPLLVYDIQSLDETYII